MTLHDMLIPSNLLLLFFAFLISSFGWKAGLWLWDRGDDTIHACIIGALVIIFIYVIQRG